MSIFLENQIKEMIEKIRVLETENAQLKLQLRELNSIIADKNRTINKLQYDSWDDCYDSFRDR